MCAHKRSNTLSMHAAASVVGKLKTHCQESDMPLPQPPLTQPLLVLSGKCYVQKEKKFGFHLYQADKSFCLC